LDVSPQADSHVDLSPMSSHSGGARRAGEGLEVEGSRVLAFAAGTVSLFPDTGEVPGVEEGSDAEEGSESRRECSRCRVAGLAGESGGDACGVRIRGCGGAANITAPLSAVVALTTSLTSARNSFSALAVAATSDSDLTQPLACWAISCRRESPCRLLYRTTKTLPMQSRRLANGRATASAIVELLPRPEEMAASPSSATSALMFL